jgi:hypothetical protein
MAFSDQLCIPLFSNSCTSFGTKMARHMAEARPGTVYELGCRVSNSFHISRYATSRDQMCMTNQFDWSNES